MREVFMKKIPAKKPAVLTQVFLILITILALAGCTPKSYSSLEDWYNQVGQKETDLSEMSFKNDEGIVTVSIKGNAIVYRTDFNEQTFGKDTATDATVRSYLDKNINSSRKLFMDMIDQFAKDSGIDAGLLSVKMEYYNPGASTPSHTQTFTKQQN